MTTRTPRLSSVCAALAAVAGIALLPALADADRSKIGAAGGKAGAARPYRLRMDLTVKKTTDISENTLPLSNNTEDEVYYSLAGFESVGGNEVNFSRTIRPSARDIWEMGASSNATLTRNLWEGALGNKDRAGFTLVINEQDNAQLDELTKLVETAVQTLIDYVGSETGLRKLVGAGDFDGEQAIKRLSDDSIRLYKALGEEKHQPIGSVAIAVIGGKLQVVSSSAELAKVTRKDGDSAEVELHGFESKYVLTLSLQDARKVERPRTELFLSNERDKCSDEKLTVHGKNGKVVVHKGEHDVPVRVGKGKLVWSCGGGNEKANLPGSTNLVRVTRASSGRDITWACFEDGVARPDFGD